MQAMGSTDFCQRSQTLTIQTFLLRPSGHILMTPGCRASSEGLSAFVEHLTNIAEKVFDPKGLVDEALCAHLNGLFH
jgi:hypothetical protein